MATILKNILRFTGLVVGVPTPLPHRLNVNGISVAPKTVEPNIGGCTIVANTTTVTVTRQVGGPAAVDVYVEFWHTIEAVTPPGNLAGLTPFILNPGGSGGGGTTFMSNCLVFKPGSGQTGPIVFDTWAALYAQLQTLRAAGNNDGCYTIQFDASTAAAFADMTIPVGAYDMTNVTWEGIPSGTLAAGSPPSAIQIADGATFTNLLSIAGLFITSLATVTPPFTYTNNFGDILSLSHSTIQAADPGAAVFAVSGGGSLQVVMEFTTIGGGLNPVLTVGAASGANFQLGPGANVGQNALATTGGGGISAEFDAASALFSEAQPAAPGLDLTGDNNNTWVRHFTDDNGNPGGYTQLDSPVAAQVGYLTLLNAQDADPDVAFDVNMPAISGGTFDDTRYRQVLLRETSGRGEFFSNADGGIHVIPFGTETIDGSNAGFFLGSGQAVTLISDGESNWTSHKAPSLMQTVFASVIFNPGVAGFREAQFNVSAIARPATGTYTITFNSPIPLGFKPDVQVTSSNGGGVFLQTSYDEVDASNITVYVQVAGVLSNAGNRFSVVVFLVPELQD